VGKPFSEEEPSRAGPRQSGQSEDAAVEGVRAMPIASGRTRSDLKKKLVLMAFPLKAL